MKVLPAVDPFAIADKPLAERKQLDVAGVDLLLVGRDDFAAVGNVYAGRVQPTVEESDAERAAFDRVFSAAFSEAVQSPLRRPTLEIREGGRAFGKIVSLDPASGESNPVARARLAVIRGGKTVAQTTTDDLGRYRIDGLEEGVLHPSRPLRLSASRPSVLKRCSPKKKLRHPPRKWLPRRSRTLTELIPCSMSHRQAS